MPSSSIGSLRKPWHAKLESLRMACRWKQRKHTKLDHLKKYKYSSYCPALSGYYCSTSSSSTQIPIEVSIKMPAKTQGKIDVHHHVYPPVFTEAIKRNGGDPSGWFVPPWTIEADHELCEQMGVESAILSCTAPGPDIEPDSKEAQKLARACNEFNARIRDDEPQKYGFFASVPSLLDTKAAIEEMTYALDTLKADGVVLMTRYGTDNHFLGHPDFTPVWDFLNARRAVVFIHPTHLVDNAWINNTLPQPSFNYPHETGKTAIDLITSNMFRDHARNCKIMLSHAGGTLPYLIDRVAGLMPFAPAQFSSGKGGEEMMTEARSFYYDTALSSSPMHLKALMALLGEEYRDHVLFGTDFPNAPGKAIEYVTEQLEGQGDVDVEALRENGLKLFPRLRE